MSMAMTMTPKDHSSDAAVTAGWGLHFILGTFVWGIAYAFLVPHLPGSAAIKGMIFGALAWVLMMVVFLPLVGQGFFGLDLGQGPVPAVMALALVLHLSYGLVLGLVYGSFGSGAAQADVMPN
jgi:uncharacterized membrane protein YagU involved in acid resistance